jgi:hypothetical protein
MFGKFSNRFSKKHKLFSTSLEFYGQNAELGTSLLWIERTLKSEKWSLIFWVKENECRAMSELSKKRVRTSLKAIAQFIRACILSSSLSERCNHGTSTPPTLHLRCLTKLFDTKFCMFLFCFMHYTKVSTILQNYITAGASRRQSLRPFSNQCCQVANL